MLDHIFTIFQPIIEPFENLSFKAAQSSTDFNQTAAIIATVVFVMIFVVISTQLLHETVAALSGAVIVFTITYVGGTFNPDLQLLTFEEAMTFVDWNVIFLIMGMMIFMAVLGRTNIFRWMAVNLYLVTSGNTWLLILSLVTLTGITSAFLNDVTAILLLVPLSIQVAVALDINPLVIVIPEILASNIGGAGTLIGDPPSTIVGSHIGLSFGEYLVNMAPIAILCMLALLIIIRLMYSKEIAGAKSTISPALLEQLKSEAVVQDRPTLIKASILAVFTLILFFIADQFGGMPPSVVALIGAALLLVWVRPNMHDMMHDVDWTTLIFFIGIFITVGALEATGAISWIAIQIGNFAGQSLNLAVVLTTWVSGTASGIVANIPFTVAALPVVDHLTATISGAAENSVLYWSLILGADLGGNATILGSAPNIVAVGLLAQAGYRVTFGRFMRDGVPVTLLTLGIATIWVLLRY